MTREPPVIEQIRADAYKIATPAPEGDGTLMWESTTIVVVQVEAGGVHWSKTRWHQRSSDSL
jgi:hypothetical protein